jgi:hypothetical protein
MITRCSWGLGDVLTNRQGDEGGSADAGEGHCSGGVRVASGGIGHGGAAWME